MWTCCACLNFRFSDALDQFMKSQTMVSRKIVPGVLTWPTTSQVIEETRKENLQVCLTTKIKILFSQMDIPKKKKKNLPKLSSVTLRLSSSLCSFPPIIKAKEGGGQKWGGVLHEAASANKLPRALSTPKPGLCREELFLQWQNCTLGKHTIYSIRAGLCIGVYTLIFLCNDVVLISPKLYIMGIWCYRTKWLWILYAM